MRAGGKNIPWEMYKCSLKIWILDKGAADQPAEKRQNSQIPHPLFTISSLELDMISL
jgi:hypothetical protein